MEKGDLFLKGLGPKDRTEKERKDIEIAWDTRERTLAAHIRDAKSFDELYKNIEGILPMNLKNIETGRNPMEKMWAWASEPLSHKDFDQGLLIDLATGKFLSHAAQTQHEFQQALKEKLEKLRRESEEGKKRHLAIEDGGQAQAS